MATIYDVDASELIKKAASDLKKVDSIKEPDWAKFVKTSAGRQRPPVEEDWWFTRAASVLRKVYVLGPIGVSKLRIKYGGKKNRGHKPEKFYPGSGNIIRKILQQLEKAEFIKYAEKGVHKGRVITPKGKKFLDKIANDVTGKTAPVKEKKLAKTEKIEKTEKAKVAAEKPAQENKEINPNQTENKENK
ncbi:30S ribosomal protein S19e [Candidatus Woesearchaeota archaeon]|nr:30S ribosomal protein S19e [Candidatus Woesearchaeota archaeon]